MDGFGDQASLIIIFREEYSYNILMTEAIVEQQQLQLVSIVQVVQSNLSKNFSIVLRRLNSHDSRFAACEAALQQQAVAFSTHLSLLEQRLADQQALLTARLHDLFRQTQSLEEGQHSLRSAGEQASSGVRRVNEELFTTQLQFEERLKAREGELAELTAEVRLLRAEQGRLSEEVAAKEDKAEAESIVKETERLRDKNTHIESELKTACHKIEKMEILSEKAERMQAKKEVEIFKEIEDRLRKEIKNYFPLAQNGAVQSAAISIANINHSKQPSISGPYASSDADLGSPSGLLHRLDQQGPSSSDYKRGSIVIDESVCNSGRGDFLRGGMGVGVGGLGEALLQKWSDKMRGFEVQLREMGQNLKALNKGSGRREVRENKENKENSEGIKDKINEIKPEVVKLWAKADTLEDRISFNERKVEEKLRVVADLASVLKENNISRLEQKLKNLQTQIFTSIKQLRTRVEGKVGQAQYEKNCQRQEERLVHLGDVVGLKSDKLQVKKALLFLEAKIKEIILVISEDEENEKDALLTKKQLKCISCDKELDKFSGLAASPKGNWDGLPFKDHPPEILGRFGMTSFGSLAKKIKKLEGKDLPVLNKRNVNQSFQNNS